MFRLEAVPRCGSFCRGSDPMVGRLSVAVRLLQCVSPSFVLGALEAHPGIPVQPVEPNASMPPTNVLSTAPRVAQPTPNRRATVGRAETALPGPATPQRPPPSPDAVGAAERPGPTAARVWSRQMPCEETPPGRGRMPDAFAEEVPLMTSPDRWGWLG